MYRNPVNGKNIILEGKFVLSNKSNLKHCYRSKNEDSINIFEKLFRLEVLDPESRKFCSNLN